MHAFLVKMAFRGAVVAMLAAGIVGGVAASTAATASAAPAVSAAAGSAPAVAATPAATRSRGVNGNPWGYNFSCCFHIYHPPASFCARFACIPNFWKSTNGYVVECRDGRYSHSGGRRGACSYHGGVWRALLRR